MIKRLEMLSSNVIALIIYTNSTSLEYFIRGTLKERFNVHKDFIVSVDSAKGVREAKLDSYVAPYYGDKWLIHVNADKLTKKELNAALTTNTVFGITVFWVSKYATFRYLQDLEIVKKMGVHCPTFTFSRLSYSGVIHLHDKMCTKRQLDRKLLDYVAKHYTYDVESICELFSLVRSGNDISTKKEVIEAIGVGGNSIDSLTIRILTAKFKNEKGRKTVTSNILKMLDDLGVSYNFETIKRFMKSNVDGFIQMKQLQIMGVYNKPNKEIPEGFDTKKLSKLRRFEWVILNQVTLPQLLNLKLCLTKYNSFYPQVDLMQVISEYINHTPLNKEA